MTYIKLTHKRRMQHPQVSLINTCLMKDFFENKLSIDEINILKDPINNLKSLNLDNLMVHKRVRLHLCFMIAASSNNLINSEKITLVDLINFGKINFNLSFEQIAKVSSLSGNIDILASLKTTFSKEQLREILEDDLIYRSVIAQGDIKNLVKLFDFEISCNQKVKDTLISFDYCKQIYLKAYGTSNIDIIKYLESLLDAYNSEEVIIIPSKSFVDACRKGYKNVAQHILEGLSDNYVFINEFFSVSDFQVSDFQYDAYGSACRYGHLDLVHYLEYLLGNNKLKAIQHNNYNAYRAACANGHLDIVKHLLDSSLTPNQIEVIKIAYYGAYNAACTNGHLEVIRHLESILGPHDTLIAIKTDSYKAYIGAFSNGHLEVIRHLESKLSPHDALIAIKTDSYKAYNESCANGHIEIIGRFDSSLKPFDMLNAIKEMKTNNYKAYRGACANGHLEVIKHLEHSFRYNYDKREVIKLDSYKAYGEACANGHLEVIKHLESSLADNDKLEAIKAEKYRAYREACRVGHLEIVKYLESFLSPTGRLDAIKIDEYYAYRAACEKGHLELVKHLESSLTPNEKIEAIKAKNYYSYREACKRGHLGVAKHLLQNESCFASAANDEGEYDFKITSSFKVISSIVSRKLSILSGKIHQFKQENPNSEFDISPNEGKQYVCILRNLILRGVKRCGIIYENYSATTCGSSHNGDKKTYYEAENLTEYIDVLINIPTVRNLCHKPINANGETNELLRLAISLGNKQAASILLNRHEVRTNAERNNLYYKEEKLGDLDSAKISDAQTSFSLFLSCRANGTKPHTDRKDKSTQTVEAETSYHNPGA